MVNCSSTVAQGSLAIDGSLPFRTTKAIADHVRSCVDCATYLDQMVSTAAMLGARSLMDKRMRRDATRVEERNAVPAPEVAVGRIQRFLAALAMSADPAHADDLVQEAWDHFLRASPSTVPTREELTSYLLGLVTNHRRNDEDAAQAWADSLLAHHPHNPVDLAESELPTDPGGGDDLRSLADFDLLDPDADRAELLFPDLYSDGPDTGGWASPPTAWPSTSRILGPDDEAQTSELYSVVDAALDELPDEVGDAVYLVDIEGHSMETSRILLERSLADIQRDLVQGRNHVRGRVNDYLSGR